ncbi:MAG: protein-methionine-sulfoxide reductase catalytic subunit MsrP [Planctomycetota bacterium]|jgi:sulfoxide reductase catalytic subunit YedY
MKIQIPPRWSLPESAATPEAVFWDRRTFLAASGALLLSGIAHGEDPQKYAHPFKRNNRYKPGRALSKEIHATRYNNFYEFTTDKGRVWKLVDKFQVKPWQIEIAGPAKKKGKHDLDDILKKLPSEERLYRFRCVERWAMTVPWIGVPMWKLIEWAQPSSKAKYVWFVSEWKPKQMPDKNNWGKHFPYYEALTMAEATNELTLLATGMYGKRMPKQNGAPVRIITPWKYGYKSPKSIIRIEFTEKRPRTFWNDLQPREYGFYSNVNPKVPHPRWSQAKEWLIPDQSKSYDTQLFNGYAAEVARLYKGMDLKKNH